MSPGTTAALQEAARQIKARGFYEPPPGLTAEARRRSPLFVRFGEAPACGRSRNHNGYREPGVCAFRARRGGDGALVLDVSESPMVRLAFHAFSRAGRPAFLVSGEEVGFGTAGEPCLKAPRLEPVGEGGRIRHSGEWGADAYFHFAGALMGFFIRRMGNGPTFAQTVDAQLEAIGRGDEADERRAARAEEGRRLDERHQERRRRPARALRSPAPHDGGAADFAWAEDERRRQRQMLREYELQAGRFGPGRENPWTW